MNQTIGLYVLEAEIGRGGTGVVFRARSAEGERVAVKVLPSIERDKLARFERERRLVGEFTARDGFVPLLDSGTTPRGAYLVMPLCEGGTLRERIQRGPFGIADAIELVRTLALALGRAHERGIVHRDMKPENVLFGGDGRPLIADLGLAKHFDRGAGTTQNISASGVGFRGTPGYMSPEQMASAKDVGPATDVFALGAMLYECLAGEAPFHGQGLIETISSVAEGRFKPLRRIRPDVPPWLAAVVQRAVSIDAARRYSCGSELARALAVSTRPRSGVALAAVTSALVAVVLAAVAAVLILRSPSPRAAEAAPRRPGRPAVAATERSRPTSGGRAAELRKRASSEISTGDYQAAIADLTRAIELEPGSAASWADRGWAKQCRGEFQAAAADATRAIELDPKLVHPLGNRAACRQRLGDLPGAIADETKAIELLPSSAKLWSDRAMARVASGDVPGGDEDARRAVEIDDTLATAWMARAYVAFRSHDNAGALRYAEKAVALDSRDGQAWAIRAAARSGLGDVDGAIADYTRALAIQPDHYPALAERAANRVTKGDFAGAIADYARVVELQPRNAKMWAALGYAKGLAGDRDGEIAAYDRALEIEPGNGVALQNRAAALAKRAESRH